jgi:hypothetical protein
VDNAWYSVGVNNDTPPLSKPSCGCTFRTGLDGSGVAYTAGKPDANSIFATLSHVQDYLGTTDTGRYFTSLYTTYTERTAVAIGSDVFMRQQVVDWAQAWQPFLENLASGDGSSVSRVLADPC